MLNRSLARTTPLEEWCSITHSLPWSQEDSAAMAAYGFLEASTQAYLLGII